MNTKMQKQISSLIFQTLRVLKIIVAKVNGKIVPQAFWFLLENTFRLSDVKVDKLALSKLVPMAYLFKI